MEILTWNPEIEKKILWQGDFEQGTSLIIFLVKDLPDTMLWTIFDPTIAIPINGNIKFAVQPDDKLDINTFITQALEIIRVQYIQLQVGIKDELSKQGYRLQ
jgi:hypothetical protein